MFSTHIKPQTSSYSSGALLPSNHLQSGPVNATALFRNYQFQGCVTPGNADSSINTNNFTVLIDARIILYDGSDFQS